jgi:hypothetical protein
MKKKKKKDEEIASCIYFMYVCLSAMIDLRSIQSICGETWRRVYWNIPRGTSYLDIDTHTIQEKIRRTVAEKNISVSLSCSLPPCSFIELREIKRGDIDLSSSTTRRC